jgi:hypothetical protein
MFDNLQVEEHYNRVVEVHQHIQAGEEGVGVAVNNRAVEYSVHTQDRYMIGKSAIPQLPMRIISGI